MSVGKYSPWCPNSDKGFEFFCYNAKKEIPSTDFTKESYDEEIHLPNYDSEGYDSYGYSAYDSNGNYVGIGKGIDRHGNTEDDYLNDSINGGDLWSNP